MIFYILACFGLTCILKYGSILNKPRDLLCRLQFFSDLFKCSLCLGFWSGVFVGIFAFVYEDRVIFTLMPLISAGTCWFLDSLLRVVQTIELFLDKKLED